MNHGFFEVLQGNTPTEGMLIQAIGEAHQMWRYGGEEAFTIVPNFLVTGILAMLVGLAVIVWSLGFVHLIGLFIAITGFVPGVSRNNPELILGICWAFVFGGGLGLMVFTFVAGFAHDIQAQAD